MDKDTVKGELPEKVSPRAKVMDDVEGLSGPKTEDLNKGTDPTPAASGGGETPAAAGASGGARPPPESWGSWFTKSFESAKVKSTEVFQYLKQDISEFGESIQELSYEVGRDLKDKLKLEDNAKAAVETVGETVNTILEQVSSIFGVDPDDDDDTSLLVSKDGLVIISRIEARIHALATNEDIFLNDSPDVEGYEAWMATFDLESKNEEMSKWLTNNPHLQLHYSQLVPDKVSHLVFWHRFYFQVYLITLEEETMAVQEELEERRLKRQGIERSSESPTDSQESGNDMVHISEEDQKRLLTEYEEEMKRVGPTANSSAHHSRRSSEQMSSSSSGSFAFVTHDAVTNEAKVE